ncbi:hypothetical protein M2272_002693 [Mycobacterium frederiksbergense]|uniref:Uncharacterized protein n=1 Tax=Mycolicibacterium frederiksbergense TaxID=117567 RepID=A0ABT6KZJ2_9MYCO|nr:hypothetical protein [Mycolicibacterium frederiksbergense]MDH6196053.1 hypothetical protein [Mycolicibacterium frederiksbergense]
MNKRIVVSAALSLGAFGLAIAMVAAPLAVAAPADELGPGDPETGHYLTPHGTSPNVLYGPNPLVIPGANLPF